MCVCVCVCGREGAYVRVTKAFFEMKRENDQIKVGGFDWLYVSDERVQRGVCC